MNVTTFESTGDNSRKYQFLSFAQCFRGVSGVVHVRKNGCYPYVICKLFVCFRTVKGKHKIVTSAKAKV